NAGRPGRRSRHEMSQDSGAAGPRAAAFLTKRSGTCQTASAVRPLRSMIASGMRPALCAIAAMFIAMPSSSADEPLTLVGAIELPNVEGRIDHLACDAIGQRLFVAALGNNTVEVLDLKAGRHLKSLGGFREPQGLAVVPDIKAIAVANGQGDGLQLVSADDL